MGFSSVVCAGCFHSIRSHESARGKYGWMSSAVLVFFSGRIVEGEYDGYGRVQPNPKSDTDEPKPVSIYSARGGTRVAAYHAACWPILGRPKNVTKVSERADDQGFFSKSSPAEPRNAMDLQALRDEALGRNHRNNPTRHLNAWGDPIEFYKLKLHRRFMIDGRRLTHMGGLPRVFVKAGPRSYWDHTLVAKKIDPRTIVQPYLGVREV